MVSTKKESVKGHHICKLIMPSFFEDTVLVGKLKDPELVFNEARVLITLIYSVIELVDGHRLPRFFGKLALLSATNSHKLKHRDEVLYI